MIINVQRVVIFFVFLSALQVLSVRSALPKSDGTSAFAMPCEITVPECLRLVAFTNNVLNNDTECFIPWDVLSGISEYLPEIITVKVHANATEEDINRIVDELKIYDFGYAPVAFDFSDATIKPNVVFDVVQRVGSNLGRINIRPYSNSLIIPTIAKNCKNLTEIIIDGSLCLSYKELFKEFPLLESIGLGGDLGAISIPQGADYPNLKKITLTYGKTKTFLIPFKQTLTSFAPHFPNVETIDITKFPCLHSIDEIEFLQKSFPKLITIYVLGFKPIDWGEILDLEDLVNKGIVIVTAS